MRLHYNTETTPKEGEYQHFIHLDQQNFRIVIKFETDEDFSNYQLTHLSLPLMRPKKSAIADLNENEPFSLNHVFFMCIKHEFSLPQLT